MSKVSFKKAAIAAVLSASIAVPATAVVADPVSDSFVNNNNQYSNIVNVSKKGWDAAKERSDDVKAVSEKLHEYANKGHVITPRSIGRAVLDNGLGGPVTRKIMGDHVSRYLEQGYVGTFIGAVVDNSILSSFDGSESGPYDSKSFTEDVRRMAVELSTSTSEFGGNITKVYMIQQDPNEINQEIKPGSIIYYMGNSPVAVSQTIDEAKADIAEKFESGWHLRDYKEIMRDLDSRADAGNTLSIVGGNDLDYRP